MLSKMERKQSPLERMWNTHGIPTLAGLALGVGANFTPLVSFGELKPLSAASILFHTYYPLKFAAAGVLYEVGRKMRNKQGQQTLEITLGTALLAGIASSIAESLFYYLGGTFTQHVPLDLSPATLVANSLGSLPIFGTINALSYFIGRADPYPNDDDFDIG